MSWGFFADLRLSLPTAAWTRVRARRPAEIPLAAGWSGLEDTGLEHAFGRPSTKQQTFADVLAWDWRGAIVEVAADGGRTRVRVCAMLDKSELELAQPLAALLDAARDEGGEGSLRLVNDGTSGAENGVERTLAGGHLTSAPLEDYESILEELAVEILPKPPKRGGPAKPMINPFTGKPITPDDLRSEKPKRGIDPQTGKPTPEEPDR
jgi:hypothetical protein